MPARLEPKRSYRPEKITKVIFIKCLIFVSIGILIGILLNPVTLESFLKFL